MEESIANRLRFARGKKGLSIQEAATAIGIQQSALWDYENPESTRRMNTESLVKICKYYNISANWLLGMPELDGTVSRQEIVADLTWLSPSAVDRLRFIKEEREADQIADAFIRDSHFAEIIRLVSVIIERNRNVDGLCGDSLANFCRFEIMRHTDDIIEEMKNKKLRM